MPGAADAAAGAGDGPGEDQAGAGRGLGSQGQPQRGQQDGRGRQGENQLLVHQGCLDITGCPAKLFPLCYLLFCRLLLMQIAKVGSFMKNSGNLLPDRHKNFEN